MSLSFYLVLKYGARILYPLTFPSIYEAVTGGKNTDLCEVVTSVLEAACLKQFTAHHACRSLVLLIPVTVQ